MEEENQHQIKVQKNLDIKQLLELEIFSILQKFIDEIELSFDYIEKKDIKEFNMKVKDLKKNVDSLKSFIENVIEEIKPIQENLTKVISNKEKIKSKDLEFLDNLKILNIDFNVFKNENKNTKKTLIKYIYNIYMCSSVIYNFNNIENENFDGFLQFMNDFKINAESSKNESQVIENKNSKNKTKNNHNSRDNRHTNRLRNGVPRNQGMPGMVGMSNMFNSLFGNDFSASPQLMNIASDIAKDIESQNIDPMSIVSSMMSGNSNPTVNNLIKNITSKIEEKISTGQIDADDLQEQATNMINNVQNNPLLKSFIPSSSQKKN